MGQSQGVSAHWEQCFRAELGTLLGAEPHPCSRRSTVPSFLPALMELKQLLLLRVGFSLSLSVLPAKNVLLQLSTQPPASKWTTLQ